MLRFGKVASAVAAACLLLLAADAARPPECQLGPDMGPCEAAIPRYYFDAADGTCKQFIYGGCEGNANNFETPEECQARCGADICTLDKDVGPCDAAISRYYFDQMDGKCKEFTYGGCEGNANNFETLQDCQAACGGDICSLEKDPGPCKAFIRRWYFDAERGWCRKFVYGGCQGNANNFETLKECRSACIDPSPPIDCAKRCCDAVAGGAPAPPGCLSTCAVTLCPAPPKDCPKECCNAVAGGYDPPHECLDVCAVTTCPVPEPKECPTLRLCCEANVPVACRDICSRSRVDCTCRAEDCCPTVSREACKEQCNLVDCAPQCSRQECCSGAEYCDPASCAAVSCPGHLPKCTIEQCCSGAQSCNPSSCAAVSCPAPEPPSGCFPQNCCNGAGGNKCEDFCKTVDCSLDCCHPVQQQGGKPCRDCGLRG